MREQASRLIALAAPPSERLGPFFTPVFTDPQIVAQRAARWRAAVGEDDERFALCLSAAGIPPSALDLALSDVILSPAGDLPLWGESLIELLDALPTGEDGQHADSPADRLLQQCHYAGRQALDGMRGRSPAPLSRAALDDLAFQLARRVVSACARAIDFDMRIQKSMASLASIGAIPMPDQQGQPKAVDEWLHLLEGHPALTYIVGVCYANWKSATQELLDRLSADEATLKLGGTAITTVRSDAGDVHCHGRSVAVLGLSDGRQIVYKPKNLASMVAFFDLVDLVAEDGLQVTMPRHHVQDFGEYGWEEFVPARDCEGPVGDFYYRLGVLLRLLQFVEARDIWLDNVLASGNVPVLIDLETIMQPRLREQAGTSQAERAAREQIEESVAAIGLVSAAVPIRPGMASEDLGVLTPPRIFRMPFRPAIEELRSAESGLDLDADGFVSWSGPPYCPTVAGRHADVRAYLPLFTDGYRAADIRLRALGVRLSASGSPLHAMAQLCVRHIVRDTWTYYELMHASLAPNCLGDGLDREIALARLFRSLSPEQVVAAEIAALRELDIPTFYASASDDHIVLADGSTLTDFFQGTAHSRLLRRIGAKNDLDEEVALIGTALECGALGREAIHMGTARWNQHANEPSLTQNVTAMPLSGSWSKRGRPDWLAYAVGVGDEILRHAIVDDHAEPAWVGITYNPRHDMSTLGVLGPDLLNGLGGLAILYTDLAAVTGLNRFATVAEQLIGALRQRLPLKGPVTAHGGMVGIGSTLYVLRRCAGVLRDADLSALVANLAWRVSLDRDSTDDIVCGRSGLLLALQGTSMSQGAAYEPLASPQSEALVASLITGLERGVLTSATPPGARRLLAVPDLDEAVRLALTRTTGRTWSVVPVTSAGAAKGDPLSAGTALARIARGCIDQEVSVSIAATIAEARNGHTVKTLDAIELQLAMHAFDEAADSARFLVKGYEKGRWFADRYAADHHLLSIVDGLPAVAHTLLRIHAPEIPSVRLLGLHQRLLPGDAVQVGGRGSRCVLSGGRYGNRPQAHWNLPVVACPRPRRG